MVHMYVMATAARQASLAKAAAASSDEFPEWEIAAFKELGSQKPKLLLLKRAASVLAKTFHLFGIDEGNEFPFVAQAGSQGAEDALKGPMELITSLRERARELARSKSAPAAFASLCENISQEVLPALEASAAAAPAHVVSASQVKNLWPLPNSNCLNFCQLVQVLKNFVLEVASKSQQGAQQVSDVIMFSAAAIHCLRRC
jgi:hypothetical protein